MKELVFATVLSELKKSWGDTIADPDLINLLYDAVAEPVGIHNKNGDPITVTKGTASKIMNRQLGGNPNRSIRSKSADDRVIASIEEYFKKNVVNRLLKGSEDDLIQRLKAIIEEDTGIADAKKQELLSNAQKKTLALFLASVYLYSLSRNNVVTDGNGRKPIKECNPPPISESLKKIKQNAIDRQEIQKWVKRDIKIGETISATPTIEECKDFPYLLPLISAFNAWSTRNYGSLSVWFKNVFSYESSDKKRAGECRKLFDHKNLISYELEEIEERALALTKIVVLVKWKSNDIVHTEHFEFGCSYQQEDGNVGYPWKNNGAWILIPWKIQGLYK